MSVSTKTQSSVKGSKGRRSTTGVLSWKKNGNHFAAADAAAAALPEPIAYLGGKQRSANRRAKCHKQFEELAQVICAMNSSTLLGTEVAGSSTRSASVASPSPSLSLPTEQLFPTLQVGYLARALGLNVSNQQAASIVELVEDDGPSTGFVNRRKLGHVLVDAIMTGTLGGPTLHAFAAENLAAITSASDDGPVRLSAERLANFVPSVCVREEEVTLLRAFEALDKDQKGYLEMVELRAAMMEGDECFSSEEVDDMWMAMLDPETNRAYYRDFAEILARE
ncbi:conserved hypothetical protein [Leishmania mexicana MHOM/GT/2001/U1103]|uniref:EF-hand domain-containing protein n=1 Tax=Leishmania mexicana (strain MHOM/GT/2001/U1103) TaxID=929439 RepID=E9B3P6_LEIMU|nr:conserved hypothetical protein [Leishmania mexicana MHOM/GT/2001/U1103]CBZ29863.1 conserved hypothetical protein [Leishmania mexicana MHOM/GT/2001/U1103]